MTTPRGGSRVHTPDERRISLIVGRNLRRFRRERKMSAEQLSRALRERGIRLQDSQIRRMETGAIHGQSTPAVTVDHLVAFCWVLQVSALDLLTPYYENGKPEAVTKTTEQ